MKGYATALVWTTFVTAVCAQSVSLKIQDDDGAPVGGAKVAVRFRAAIPQDDVERIGATSEDGRFRCRGSALVGIDIEVSKSGFYDSNLRNLTPGQDIVRTLLLRRVVHPVPLYAYRFEFGTGRGLRIPVRDNWVGFDMQQGDWVAPAGIGNVADFRVRFHRDFRGYRSDGEALKQARELSQAAAAMMRREWTEEQFMESAGKWDASVEFDFPGEGAGFVEVTDRYADYCGLKAPHRAPESGYLSSCRRDFSNQTASSRRSNRGYFFRTRVRTDSSGRIVSANYSKVYGDLDLDPTGLLFLWYYFNPAANDTNLEYDTERNLFGTRGDRLPVLAP